MVTKKATKRPKPRPNPAEIPVPEIGTGGSGGVIPSRPGGIGGPNELPIDFRESALINEVLSLRQRLHAMETQVLTSALRTGRFFHPAELPEGGEGGGGEILPELPGEFNPAELPAGFSAKDFAILNARVASLEANLTKSIAALAKSISQLKTK